MKFASKADVDHLFGNDRIKGASMDTQATQRSPSHPAQPKPPSKKALKAAEAQARREAREKVKEAKEAEKEAIAAQLVISRAAATAVMAKPIPSNWQEWGVTRTRTYKRLREIIESRMWNATMKPDTLDGWVAELERVSSLSLTRCQTINLPRAQVAAAGDRAASA